MTGIDHVAKEILGPMQATFLPPRQNMDDGALGEALRGYIEALRGFAAVDLHLAWADIVASHTSRSWPVPAVIVLAARKARNDRLGDADGRVKPKYQKSDHKDRWNVWLSVRGSQLARDAAEAGCSWSVKCAILNDGKKAHEISLAELIRRHESALETADAIAGGSAIPYNGRHIKFEPDDRKLPMKMWANVLRNENDTAEEIRRAA